MSRYCLLLFLLPGVCGVHQGFRISRIKFSYALFIAVALTLLIVPTWSSSWLQTRIPQNALLAWVLSVPAWYLAFSAWMRRGESQVGHAG